MEERLNRSINQGRKPSESKRWRNISLTVMGLLAITGVIWGAPRVFGLQTLVDSSSETCDIFHKGEGPTAPGARIIEKIENKGVRINPFSKNGLTNQLGKVQSGEYKKGNAPQTGDPLCIEVVNGNLVITNFAGDLNVSQ